MLLELRNIGHSYGENTVLSGVSLSLEAGSSVAVMSPSGTGKSTMLSIAGLLLEPTEGDVLIDGQAARGLSDGQLSALRRDTFGFLFQHTQLIGSLRALENVMAPVSFMRLSSGERAAYQERAQELLSSFGLEDRMHHFPFQLSGGQKRRVMLARALLLRPRVVIADEPTNDLDAESVQSVAKALFNYVEEGGALLLATHDTQLASQAQHLFNL